MVYDAANRLTETIYPDADADDGIDANNPRTINVYADAGRLTATSDPNSHTTAFGYQAPLYGTENSLNVESENVTRTLVPTSLAPKNGLP